MHHAGSFGTLRRCFRMIDEDKSNECTAHELWLGLRRMFNLDAIPPKVMSRLFELMDTSGDGSIRLDEFCRFFTVRARSYLHQQPRRTCSRLDKLICPTPPAHLHDALGLLVSAQLDEPINLRTEHQKCPYYSSGLMIARENASTRSKLRQQPRAHSARGARF